MEDRVNFIPLLQSLDRWSLTKPNVHGFRWAFFNSQVSCLGLCEMCPSEAIAVSIICTVNVKGECSEAADLLCFRWRQAHMPVSICHLLVTECLMLVTLRLVVRVNLSNIANVGIDTLNIPHLQHYAEAHRKRNICGRKCIEGCTRKWSLQEMWDHKIVL